MATKKAKKRKVEVSEKGIVHIKAGSNNTLITVTNLKGQTIASSSAGQVGYRNTKKGTPYVAAQVALDAARKAIKAGVKEAEVRIKGISSTKEHAIRALPTAGLNIYRILDITPEPHGGCRPPKAPKG